MTKTWKAMPQTLEERARGRMNDQVNHYFHCANKSLEDGAYAINLDSGTVNIQLTTKHKRTYTHSFVEVSFKPKSGERLSLDNTRIYGNDIWAALYLFILIGQNPTEAQSEEINCMLFAINRCIEYHAREVSLGAFGADSSRKILGVARLLGQKIAEFLFDRMREPTVNQLIDIVSLGHDAARPALLAIVSNAELSVGSFAAVLSRLPLDIAASAVISRAVAGQDLADLMRSQKRGMNARLLHQCIDLANETNNEAMLLTIQKELPVLVKSRLISTSKQTALWNCCVDALLAVQVAKESPAGKKPMVSRAKFDKVVVRRAGVASGAAFAASKSRVVQQVVAAEARLGDSYKPMMHELMTCRDADSLDSFERKYHEQLAASDASLDSRATGGKGMRK